MPPEIFTSTDILPHQPPVVIAKPWFAQGWVIGLLFAVGASAMAGYAYFNYMPWQKAWIIMAALLWLVTISKYFRGIRTVEVYADMIRVYGRDVVKPVGEIRFEDMTVINDVDELYFIRKGKFSGGIYLKKVYWGDRWGQIRDMFNYNASYVCFRFIREKGETYEPNFPGQVISYRRDRDDMFSGFAVLFDLVVGVVLHRMHKQQKPKAEESL